MDFQPKRLAEKEKRLVETLLKRIAERASEIPCALAIEEDGFQLTWREFDQISDQIARGLSANGAQPRQVVCYLGTSILRRVLVLVATLKSNMPLVVLNPRDPPKAVAAIAYHAGASHFITGSPGLEATINAIGLKPLDISDIPKPTGVPFEPAAAEPADTAYSMYTSGSSGQPKGVPTTRRIAMHGAFLESKAGGVYRGDRISLLGQVWFSYIISGLFWGAELYCYDFAGRGAAGIPDWMRQRRITYSDSYPAMLRAVMNAADAPVESLRAFLTNGEPILKDDIENFEWVFSGADLAVCYGFSEYVLICRYLHRHGAPFPYAAAPLGEPIEPEYFHLLGPDGQPVPQGEPGEAVMISPMTIQGYHNDPERSSAVFPLDSKTGLRRYHTGDFSYSDAAGKLRSTGRADDQIKIRGYTLRTSDLEQEIMGVPGVRRVSDAAGKLRSTGRADDQIKIRGYTLRTSDLEQEIMGVPGVRRVIVTGFSGPRGIQRLACHFEVEGEPAPTGEIIRAYLRTRVPGFYIRHERLPTTATGKILRHALPNPLDGHALPEASKVWSSPAEETVAGIWRDIFGHGDFGRSDDFFDIDGDSLQAMSMLIAIEQRFRVRIPLETLILEGAAVDSLAGTIDGLAARAGAVEPVRMNSGGPGGPLYALHVIGGHLSDYLELAHAFSGVRPVQGIGATLDLADNAAISLIAGRAAAMLEANGGPAPISLFGFSAGAAFALETARALVERGMPPPSLIMLDANCAWLDKLR